ncbi:MAG: protein arginine kinase [Eubacteriaceae bacterium]
MELWNSGNKEKDIVMSCRIRLARNIQDLLFPAFLPDIKAKEIVDLVEDTLVSQPITQKFSMIEIDNMSLNARKILVEKHLTSPELGNNKHASVFIRDDEKVSIMINEEDHIRIQCILEGFQLNDAYNLANEIDDILEQKIKYSFNEKYGYLTSCPSNVGTGMRASVMLHLPSLSLSNQINTLVHTLAKFGLTIRGIYGEGTQALGDLFQISNQTTLGLNEEEIIINLHRVAKEIIKREREIRYEILNNNKLYLEDKIFRAYGILTNARTINSQESMKLLSLVRLGCDLDLLDKEINIINDLMTTIQPGILADIYGGEISEEERDKIRAHHIRKNIVKNK